MARPGFYDDNANRSFPFLKGESFVPKSAVVDAGFLMGIGSGYVEGTHHVWLASVSQADDEIIFEFRCDAPGLVDIPLLFGRFSSDPAYTHEYADSDCAGNISEVACDVIHWSGYMVTGPLEALVAALVGGDLAGSAIVEPALVRNLAQSQVRSINIANQERTRATSPDGCREICWPESVELHVRAACLQGPIRFKEGYNCSIRQDNNSKLLLFQASVGMGLGEPYAQVPIYDGEVPPEGSTLLEGGQSCEEVVRSINGVGGRALDIQGGPGVNVTSYPDQHLLVVDVNMHSMAVCYSCDTPPEYPSESDSNDPCECGPS